MLTNLIHTLGFGAQLFHAWSCHKFVINVRLLFDLLTFQWVLVRKEISRLVQCRCGDTVCRFHTEIVGHHSIRFGRFIGFQITPIKPLHMYIFLNQMYLVVKFPQICNRSNTTIAETEKNWQHTIVHKIVRTFEQTVIQTWVSTLPSGGVEHYTKF